MRETFVKWYLDYVNNYLTVEKFAEHNGVSVDQANQIIKLGKEIHETPHPES